MWRIRTPGSRTFWLLLAFSVASIWSPARAAADEPVTKTKSKTQAPAVHGNSELAETAESANRDSVNRESTVADEVDSEVLDATDETIRRWVSELDAPDFRTRMRATRRLEDVGDRSVPFLVDSLDTSGLEGVTRAMRLLERFYTADDERTVSAAESVLEGLVAGTGTDAEEVAYEAQRVLSANAEIRNERALAEIDRLGGSVKFHSMRAAVFVNGRPVISHDQVSHIIIGDQWTGGDEGLRYLKRLDGLQSVYVTGDTVSTAALDDLVRTVPNLKLQIRGSACLGIGSGPNPTGVAGCWITRVEQNSAAEKAGIMTGDVITRFGDKSVENFDQLVEAIKEKKAGDQVVVEVRRRGQQMEFPVVLGAWDQ